jgi:hypothetical protein
MISGSVWVDGSVAVGMCVSGRVAGLVTVRGLGIVTVLQVANAGPIGILLDMGVAPLTPQVAGLMHISGIGGRRLSCGIHDP